VRQRARAGALRARAEEAPALHRARAVAREPKALRAFVCGAGVLAAAGALASAARAPACAPRSGERLGVRFVEVCASHTSAFADADAHAPEALPAVWIAATPLPCSAGRHETVGCDTVTALEASPAAGRGKNEPLAALVVEAELAHRICTLRFGGRLPTPLEREQARRLLGLASLRVRADAGAARLHFDDLPEWVAEGDCAAEPARAGPSCRIRPFPPVTAWPSDAEGERLACVAEPAGPDAGAVAIGGACAEGPRAGALRRPACALELPDAGVRFALTCRDLARAGAAAPGPLQAAVRCVLPARELAGATRAP
jgi:hypothetical protein